MIGEVKRPTLERVERMRATASGAMVRYGVGIEARRCWVAGSVAKQQTGKRSVQSAQSGRAALFGIEKSHGRKGREWTNTLSLGNAMALSSLPGTSVPAKAAGKSRGSAWFEGSVIVEARKRRRQETECAC